MTDLQVDDYVRHIDHPTSSFGVIREMPDDDHATVEWALMGAENLRTHHIADLFRDRPLKK
ncbi:hypothetical protein ACPA54_15200 [Uniformispora flossi]|uniref:hypothetical protein n=1 Tax=Uniformispora flossi TaxID=3390723 RepID=UPI003C309975